MRRTESTSDAVSYGSLFNLRRLKAQTKTLNRLIRDLCFAEDSALVAHTGGDLQQTNFLLHSGCQVLEFEVILKKTEVLYQRLKMRSTTHWQGQALPMADTYVVQQTYKGNKIRMYIPIVLVTIRHTDSWITYRNHVRLLKRFHQRCLRTNLE